jgi:SAM-dependent methyltransferase
VQMSWTGTHGERLLAQSLEFVRMMEAGYRKITGRALADTDILDFGCGWGRIMRLMLRYTPPSKLYGVDPWDESLELCRERNLPGQLALSDYVPRSLPFGEQKFDLIYAYSVFTHLSAKTAGIAQQTLLGRLNKDGVLVMTVRPEIYWRGHHYWPEGCTPESMMALHRANGIAYIPHIRPPIDGDITFGDTSIAQEYIRREWKGWKLVEAMPLAQDPMQHVLFLRPRLGIRGWFGL